MSIERPKVPKVAVKEQEKKMQSYPHPHHHYQQSVLPSREVWVWDSDESNNHAPSVPVSCRSRAGSAPLKIARKTNEGKKGAHDKDLNIVLQDGLDALALPRHVGQRGTLPSLVRRRRAEQVRSEDDGEVRAAHLVHRLF